MDARAQMRWVMGLRRQGGAAMGLALGLPLLAGALLVPQAWALAQLLAARDPVMLLPLAAIFALRILIGTAGEAAAIAASARIGALLRRALYGRMLGGTLPRGSSGGALAAGLVEQVEALDGFLVRFLPAMAQAALLPIAFAAVLLPVDIVVALLLAVTAPLVPLFMALVGWGAEAAARERAGALARLAARFADRLRGLTVLALLGRAEAETAGAMHDAEALRRNTLAVLRIAFLSSAVLELFAALGVAGVALYTGLTLLGLVELRAAPLDLSLALYALLLAPEVYQPLRQLAVHYHDRADAKAAAAQLEVLFGTLPDLRPASPAAPGARLPAGPQLLRHPQLLLAPGQHLALMGPSGCGKTTLLETLARLRPAPEGCAIRLGGLALAEIDEADLRRHVGWLGQAPLLRAGSIADNIRLGAPAGGDAVAAAERAGVMRFAAHLPHGLETRIGEGGLGLSGGEAQRVALARLYLRNPHLLLLDEPTAHLDTETEAVVLDGLMEFAAGRSLLMATHSPAAAQRLHGVLHLWQEG